jgi:hypothetical protein
MENIWNTDTLTVEIDSDGDLAFTPTPIINTSFITIPPEEVTAFAQYWLDFMQPSKHKNKITREELEDNKYPLFLIKEMIDTAQKEIGKVGCTHKTNIARAMIKYNCLVNEELERGRFGALK